VDTSGQIMDIHDGDTLKVGPTYFYYGAQYGSCKEPAGENGCADFGIGNCGFRLDHNVSLFTSDDLGTWHRQPVIFEMKKHPIPGIMFCPKVIYNPPTKKYVLWYNWLPAKGGGFGDSYYGVAVSNTPYGPFIISNINVTLGNPNTGDFALFLDDDGSGYIIYTALITGSPISHRMSIEKLNPDFLSTQGLKANSGYFGDSFVEAPTMFKRNGHYFAVFGSCCCYCGVGSPVTYYRANAPLGPYTKGTLVTDSSIHAQQTNILRYQSLEGEQFMWQGDRWQSSPDGEKGHDFTYFGAITFDSNGNPQTLHWVDSFVINM